MKSKDLETGKKGTISFTVSSELYKRIMHFRLHYRPKGHHYLSTDAAAVRILVEYGLEHLKDDMEDDDD